jgi:hypothetical protein
MSFFQVENIVVNPSGEARGFQFWEVAEISSDFSTNILNADQLVAVNAAPEPSTVAIVGMGLGAMLWLRRRNRPNDARTRR